MPNDKLTELKAQLTAKKTALEQLRNANEETRRRAAVDLVLGSHLEKLEAELADLETEVEELEAELADQDKPEATTKAKKR